MLVKIDESKTTLATPDATVVFKCTNPPPDTSTKLKTPDELVCKNLSVAGAVDGKVKV